MHAHHQEMNQGMDTVAVNMITVFTTVDFTLTYVQYQLTAELLGILQASDQTD